MATKTTLKAAPVRLANYLLGDRLGKGFFGVVFRAVDEANRDWAVKRFRAKRQFDDGSEEPADASDAKMEIESATRLMKQAHPNIVNVKHLLVDAGDEDYLAGHAIVFEFCHEGTLLSFIEDRNKRRIPLTTYEIIAFAQQVRVSDCVLVSTH